LARPKATDYAHGTRSKYRSGCRCVACREYNSDTMNKYRKLRQEKGEYVHGTYTSYTLGCRCELCLNAKRDYEIKAHEIAISHDTINHGSVTGYRYGCRCELCTSAHVISDRNRRRDNPNWNNPSAIGFIHGGTYGYSRGCRCIECVDGHKNTVTLWRQSDRGRLSSKHSNALRRARMLNAIAVDSDISLIEKIYDGRPRGYDVDHIIPLSKGGLHHQDNLQYLPSKINSSKHNKLSEEHNKFAIAWQIFILPVTTIPSGSRTQESSKDAKSGIRTVI